MKYSKTILLILTCTALSFWSCKKDCALEPVLNYKSISKTFMVQNGADSLLVTFSFEDGDGNIGNDIEDNVFVRDARTHQLVARYRIPEMNANRNRKGSRQGDITLILYSQCCIYPDSSSCYANSVFPVDTMSYTIQVIDKAGNSSNVITTDRIQLDCE